jgi:hypothetical protein
MSTQPVSGAPPHRLVNDRVLVRYDGQTRAGRISSIHRHADDVEYVIRLDDEDGGMGVVVNVWSTGGRCTLLSAIRGVETEGRRSA